MLIALSTAHQIGLAVTAAIFIGFALVSSFVLPNRNPNFPGKNRNLYIGVCVLLFLAMMGAVLVFGKEPEEAGAEGHETTTTETQPAETGTTSTSTSTTPSTGGPTGNAAAGKVVFQTKGCGACHTLKAAGSTGAVGPNLDEAKPEYALIVDRVTNGKGAMPPFKGQLTETQIEDVATYVYESTHSS